MSTQWRSNSMGMARTAVMISLILVTGCMRPAQKGIPQPEPAQTEPATVPVAPPPVVPEPTQEDLAFDAASKAAADGDPERAMRLYESAASLSTNDDRLAEIHFALGLLHSDPTSVSRDLARGRAELQRVIDNTGDSPRIRDARILAALLDEMALLRAQSVEQRAENDDIKARLTALTERLDQKERELAEIKKILLQEKKKP